MKGWIWFVVGLVVGGAIMWLYGTYVMTPKLVTQTEVTVKEQFEQSQIEKQKFLTATITAISGTTIEAFTEKEDQEQTVMIQTTSATKLYARANDDAATKTAIALSELTPGSIITVVTSDIIDLTKPINATEIIKL